MPTASSGASKLLLSVAAGLAAELSERRNEDQEKNREIKEGRTNLSTFIYLTPQFQKKTIFQQLIEVKNAK